MGGHHSAVVVLMLTGVGAFGPTSGMLSQKIQVVKKPRTVVEMAPPQIGLVSTLAGPLTRRLGKKKVETGKSYLPEETIERALEGNKVEKAKMAKDPTAAWTEIYDFADQIRRGTLDWKTMEDADANIRLKWLGLLSRFKRTPGTFMMRLRTPNGITSAAALRLYADALEPYERDVGVADITTRQNLQLRGLTLEDAADLLKELPKVNMTSHQSALDNVRNVVGSPLAGLDEDELLDTRPYCNALNDLISLNPKTGKRGNPKWGNLPRKFNIAVSSCPADYAHGKINDLAFEAVPHAETGEIGFNVVVGGYFSAKRVAHSIDLGVWIPATVENVLDVSTVILEIFRDNGTRKDRSKGRLMWLVEQYGVQKFKDIVVSKVPFETQDHQHVSQEMFDKYSKWKEMVGVHEQPNGLHRVGFHVPVGRLSIFELRSIADAAEKHSDSEIRLTVDQNLMFPNVENPDKLIKDLSKTSPRLSADPKPVSGNTVSCTGSQFCPFGLIETKAFAERISKKLDKKLNKPLRLHVTGCPNSCGQAQMADIGLMGAVAKRKDPTTGKFKAVPGVDVFVGGTIGIDPFLAEKPLIKGLAADDEDALVEELVQIANLHIFKASPPSATKASSSSDKVVWPFP